MTSVPYSVAPCGIAPHGVAAHDIAAHGIAAHGIAAPEAAQTLKGVTHVYTDLDGTLFAPGGRLLAAHDGSPSVATAQALVALKDAGIEVIIVTGRSLAQGTEIMRILHLNTFIGELGCMIQEGYGATARVSYALGDWEHTVLADGLAPGELPPNTSPAELIQASGIIERLIGVFPGKLEPHNPYQDTRKVTLMLRGNIDCKQAERILEGGTLPLQLLDNGIIHPQEHTLVDCSEVHIYHIMPKGAGKGFAVGADMSRRGLSREQTVAVGDAIGDMTMGEYTGSFVLVNNGDMGKIIENYRGGKLFTTQGLTADGWAEFARALLAALPNRTQRTQ